MSGWGEKLAGIDAEQLRQQLHTETDPKAVKRLTVALLYLDGYSPNRIEQLLGVPAVAFAGDEPARKLLATTPRGPSQPPVSNAR